MSNLSFAVNYTKTKATSPNNAIEYEKCFLTLSAALNFCIELIESGGEVLYIIQFIRGTQDAIFEGDQLHAALDLQRARLVVP